MDAALNGLQAQQTFPDTFQTLAENCK